MGKTVLVVDDDRDVRELIELVLTEYGGYTVVAADCAGEALTLVDGGLAFDLLLADRRMPDLWGEHLIARLRERGCDQPMVLLTGDVQAPMTGAADAVFLKPFEITAFISAVQALLVKAQTAVPVT